LIEGPTQKPKLRKGAVLIRDIPTLKLVSH
jgi:hypothetical protein